MKIGILTYHRAINYGAVTQCYALSLELKKRFPDDTVEIIDYATLMRVNKYKPTLTNYLFGGVSKKQGSFISLKRIASKIKKLIIYPDEFKLIRQKYNSFQKSMESLPLSDKKLLSDSTEEFRKTYKNDYDVIVVGSDCVWEWTTIPFPNAYYLCGNFKAKKMSYAASAGTDDVEMLSEKQKEQMTRALKDFLYIGVRDWSTEYVVKNLCSNIKTHHNCDPTTLLEAELLSSYREKVAKKLKDAGINDDKPIIGVMGYKKYFNIAYRMFGDSVYYVGLYEPHPKCDANLLDITVLEWASSFGLFDLTITTFFHGTMLSLVNHTPVFSFDYLPETDKQFSKLHELYLRLDLPGFYYRDKAEYSNEDINEMSLLAKKLIKNPPKQKIAEELKKESASCESFFEFLAQIKLDIGEDI